MARIINVNTATTDTLSKLPGVGPALAARIVEYREKVGKFRTIEELAAVAGVNDRMLDRFRDRVGTNDAGDDKDEETLPPLNVVVMVKPEPAGELLGYTLTVAFTQRQWITGADESRVSVWVPTQRVAAVAVDGNVPLVMPNRSDMQGDVTFKVFSPDGELMQTLATPGEKLPEKITIAIKLKRYAKIEPNDDPSFGKPTRLKGRVIDKAGKQQVSKRQVVIWGATGAEPGPADFRALIVAETDANGYFSGPFPLGEFSRAHGDVSVDDEPQSVPIHLNEDGTFPESVILVVEMKEASAIGEEDDCECHKGASDVPRDPDRAELTRADGTFSSDPGAGRCVDFTKPDRTLEEFSYTYVVRTTEPSIKGLTLQEPSKIDLSAILGVLTPIRATSAVFAAAAPAFTSAAFTNAAGASATTNAAEARELSSAEASRAAMTSSLSTTKIDARILKALASDPDGFSLTKIAAAADLTAHADLIRVVSQHIGKDPGRTRLSCGNPVDWDDDPTIYQACSIAHGHVLRFKQEWVADGYSMGNLLYSLPLAPGQKKQIAVVDWERREVASRTEQIQETEALDAAISRDRDINEIVSGTVNENVRGGSSSSSSSFAGGLGIGAIIGPVGGLLGVGGGTASANTQAWQNSSRNMSTSALNQLRDRTVQSASSVRSQRSSVVQTVKQGERVVATTETVANYNHCHAITIQYFEVLRHLLVRQRIVDVQECLFIPLLMSRFNSDKALRWKNTLRPAVNRALRGGFDALDRMKSNYSGSDFPVGTYADQLLEHTEGDLYLRFQLARPKDTDDDFDANSWVFLGHLFPFISPTDFYKQYLKGQALKDKVFMEQMAPRIAERFVQHMQFYAVDQAGVKKKIPVDTTLVSDFVNDRALYVSIRLASELPPIARKDIKYIEISDTSGILGLPFFQILPTGSKVIVESGTMRYRTKFSSGTLFRDSRVQNDLTGGDAVRIFTPLSRDELRNPREEDKELSRNLLAHLNEHIEPFHHWIWKEMSEHRRFMLLDGFEAPNSGGRSVASVVENELIGIVGNSLIMPVARGFHLDPTFRQDLENPIDLLEHYEPSTPIEPMRIAVPTRGVYAEAVMGACNSCEQKEEQRFWRWEESPIPDSPTAIQPVSTETRRAEPPDLTAKDFPTPIINLQNAPAAPDPTGLAAAMQLLGTPNLFKDITGIEGTQKNAAAALQSAFDTAQFFGGKAADLALQAKMSRDIDKAMKSIQSAKQNGLISDKQAEELTTNAIRGMIGGGANSQSPPISSEDVKSLTDKAGQNQASVKVTRPTGEKIEVDASKPAQDGTAEDGTRSFIILSDATGTPENRAFNPTALDKSGVIDLEVSVRRLPTGGSVRWSDPSGGPLTIDNPSNLRTRVRGARPGRTAIDVEVRDSGGNRIESMKIQLCVPQFVRVTENKAAFEAVLTQMNLLSVKDEVVRTMKQTCDRVLRQCNCRTIWQVGPFSETMPAHIPAANVTNATITGEPPVDGAGNPTHLMGITNAVPNGSGGFNAGPDVFNETIEIYPGGYDNPLPNPTPPGYDVDVESQALVIELENQTSTNPAFEAFAIKVIGRLLGETLAHEIVHSLLWFNIPTGHNNPAIAGDLMNQYKDRSFTQRTGMVDTSHTSPVDPANFTDNGIDTIGLLQATNKALMDRFFPVTAAMP